MADAEDRGGPPVALVCAQCGRGFEWKRRSGAIPKICSQACRDARALEGKKRLRRADPERHRGYGAKSRAANIERVRERGRKYHAANKERSREMHRVWYEKNREQAAENSRSWKAANRERYNARKRELRASDPERFRAYDRERRAEDPERALARDRRWKAANVETVREKSRQWKLENPERALEHVRATQHRRRAKKRSGQCEPYKAIDIFERDSWICQLCRGRVDKKLKHPSRMRATIDHIVPIAHDGADAPHNVQLAHLDCNIKKNTKPCGSQLRLPI